uniref:Pentatricopeptide repeat-containing protein At2g36240 family n=1 Tax=Cajanus cajan TaxID=3821 RepID=A0A151TVR8_CAJCA|nr:Pentatricopeptide repeat-containing protein At2g36240 family [Cajanus cajan]
MAMKKLLKVKGSPPWIPNLPLPSPPQDTSVSPTHYARFLDFLKAHWAPPLSPDTLLHFLKSKLHHHPSFSRFDFHLFTWATTLDSFRHTHSTFHWMAHTLAATHRHPELRTLLTLIAANPCPCSPSIFSCPQTQPIFRTAIHAFARSSKLHDAVSAFHTMRKLIDGKPNVAVCNILLHAFVKNAKLDCALHFYRDMVDKYRVKPDVFTFNILISGYCRNSQFASALEIFNEMGKLGCYPNVVTFNTLIRGMFREGNVDDAIGMAREMVELGKGFEPDCMTYRILVMGYMGEGGREEGELLVNEMLDRGFLPDLASYNELMSGLTNCRRSTNRKVKSFDR